MKEESIYKSHLINYFVREWEGNQFHFIDGLPKGEIIKLAKEHVEDIVKNINDNRATS